MSNNYITFNGIVFAARVKNDRIEIFDAVTGYTIPAVRQFEVSYDYQNREEISVKSVAIICYMRGVKGDEPLILTITQNGVAVSEY